MSFLIFLVAIVSIALKTYMLMDLWNIFLVPLGLMKISYLHMLGLSLMHEVLTFDYMEVNEYEKYALSDRMNFVIGNLFSISVFYGIALIVQKFM